jgi:hypothetical protein
MGEWINVPQGYASFVGLTNLQRKQIQPRGMQFSFIFLLIWGWKVIFHPFYISLTEIRYKADQKTLEIEQKIFWDDLEVALSKDYGKKVNFLQPVDKGELDRMIREYLLFHNKISVNGQLVALEFLGYEIEEDAAWFYFEAKKIPVPKTVEVTNTSLFEHFEGQQHIINFYLDKKPKSLILIKGKETGRLGF